jgi:two-component system response regulator NreC
MTTSNERIRLLLVDDHRILREALRAVLEPECEVVGEAADGEHAIVLAAQLKPHVVILDVEMPGLGGLAAAYRIAREAPAAKVLVLSQYDDEEYVLEALGEAGVAGYLVKTDAAEELMSAVRVVHSGRRYVSPSIAPIVLAQLNRPASERREPGAARLTRREREVLRFIGEGATTKEVALKLGISPKTAQVHRENLKQKLDLRSTAAIVRYAIKHKLIRLD